jgi:hypothetical protein
MRAVSAAVPVLSRLGGGIRWWCFSQIRVFFGAVFPSLAFGNVSWWFDPSSCVWRSAWGLGVRLHLLLQSIVFYVMISDLRVSSIFDMIMFSKRLVRKNTRSTATGNK